MIQFIIYSLMLTIWLLYFAFFKTNKSHDPPSHPSNCFAASQTTATICLSTIVYEWSDLNSLFHGHPNSEQTFETRNKRNVPIVTIRLLLLRRCVVSFLHFISSCHQHGQRMFIILRLSFPSYRLVAINYRNISRCIYIHRPQQQQLLFIAGGPGDNVRLRWI